jgi:hypothetical protein
MHACPANARNFEAREINASGANKPILFWPVNKRQAYGSYHRNQQRIKSNNNVISISEING